MRRASWCVVFLFEQAKASNHCFEYCQGLSDELRFAVVRDQKRLIQVIQQC
jgi:hypothetical protein